MLFQCVSVMRESPQILRISPKKQYNLFVYPNPRFLSMLEMIRGFLFLFFTLDSTNVV